jgi:hypothetical protein
MKYPGWNRLKQEDLRFQLRVSEEITLRFQEPSRPHGKARGGRIASYLTDKQRSQAGWIGALKCEIVFEQALRFQMKSIWP